MKGELAMEAKPAMDANLTINGELAMHGGPAAEHDLGELAVEGKPATERELGLQRQPAVEGEPSAPFRSGTVSFVRRDNRLRPRLQRTWDQHHETLLIDVPRVEASMSVAPGFVLDQVGHFGRLAPLVVEIGSGTGDAVVQGAQARPGTNFLGVEVYLPGLAATMAKIVRHDLTNVRLVQADAVQVLEHMLGRGSVAEIWVFFADPWHKMRHHKRRLVTPGFAELAASRLEPGGTMRLATDWADYARQMRDVLAACGSLTNPHGTANARTGFAPRFDGRSMTAFEQKGLASGRTIYDLELQRTTPARFAPKGDASNDDASER